MVVAEVKLWDKYVGAVLWDSQSGVASFELDPGFMRNNWNIAPITMPLSDVRNGKIFRFP